MTANIDYPVIQSPELIDRVIVDVQKGLSLNLGWLNFAFGRAQRLVKNISTGTGTKKIYTPNVYKGNNEYFSVAPDSEIGNFSFFMIDDPQSVDWQPNSQGSMSVDYSLIFWFDLRKVFDTDSRNTEAVKAEILKVLNGRFQFKSGRLTVTKIYDQAENIYRGLSLDEVDNQYLMHPYAGFRFEGRMFINERC